MAARTLKFTKMHGLGNDFVVVDGFRKGAPRITAALARKMGDRRLGIGFDQLLWLLPSKKHDARMVIYNPDGSEAEMCGNGIRAAALYLKESVSRFRNKKQLEIETLGGLIRAEFRARGIIAVDMGKPGLRTRGLLLHIQGERVECDDVDMGNPHAVVWVGALAAYPAESHGPALENDAHFPNRTNVEFVEKTGPSEIRVRVWERGAGFTLACGTGACASVVSGIARGLLTSPVRVRLPGGNLVVRWSGQFSDSVVMEGPATRVFEGEFSWGT